MAPTCSGPGRLGPALRLPARRWPASACLCAWTQSCPPSGRHSPGRRTACAGGCRGGPRPGASRQSWLRASLLASAVRKFGVLVRVPGSLRLQPGLLCWRAESATDLCGPQGLCAARLSAGKCMTAEAPAAPAAKQQQQRLKAVVRNLPPLLTEEEFLAAAAKACPAHGAGWIRFTPGKVRCAALTNSARPPGRQPDQAEARQAARAAPGAPAQALPSWPSQTKGPCSPLARPCTGGPSSRTRAPSSAAPWSMRPARRCPSSAASRTRARAPSRKASAWPSALCHSCQRSPRTRSLQQLPARLCQGQCLPLTAPVDLPRRRLPGLR